ncbi:hypothetical protein [Nonomuraea sp. NPDC050783]|uniref:hypothetical protein n=1 Tax=Nonomuraea sp. NPDC050783 TaxID=3154634 RepID=UPI00346780E5
MSELTFLSDIVPGLESGDYTVVLTQDVDLNTGSWTTTRTFQVAGERFTLAPDLIGAVFPPAGSLGDHALVLPHLVLNRATLPWERESGAGPGLPWLVLLVFSGDEQPAQRTAALGTLPFAAPEPPHQSADDPVNVIDVPRDLLAGLMPPVADLPYLAHVRRTGDGDRAVVMSRRLPAAGTSSTAHLVSVEGRYDASGFVLGDGDGPVPLVTLASWTFACDDDAQTFAGLAAALAGEGSPFRLPDSGDPGADAFLAQGQVPVRHRLRQGGRTVSWYRGPLVTGALSGDPPPVVRTSDRLLRYHPDAGMFETGYAAAWQLGRLITLQHTATATALYGWKRRRAQLSKRTDPAGHPLAVAPIDDTPPAGALALLQDLAVLRGVPLRYLIPDERLLPVETVRFFQLDRSWVAALLDGASSVGRITAADAEADQASPLPVEPPEASGALIRSELVSGYPDLLVEAYATDAADQPLPLLRAERLAPTIMVCLFEGVMSRFDLCRRPESQHFAVEAGRVPGEYAKTLRTGTGDPGPSLPSRPLGPRSTIPVAALAAEMATALADPADTFGSAQFARQMIETADRVTYLRAAPPPPS